MLQYSFLFSHIATQLYLVAYSLAIFKQFNPLVSMNVKWNKHFVAVSYAVAPCFTINACIMYTIKACHLYSIKISNNYFLILNQLATLLLSKCMGQLSGITILKLLPYSQQLLYLIAITTYVKSIIVLSTTHHSVCKIYSGMNNFSVLLYNIYLYYQKSLHGYLNYKH